MRKAWAASEPKASNKAATKMRFHIAGFTLRPGDRPFHYTSRRNGGARATNIVKRDSRHDPPSLVAGGFAV